MLRLHGDDAPRAPQDVLAALSSLNTLRPDVYATGGSVERLERAMAKALGKPAAVFLPTGTLANLLAVRALCGRRKTVVAPADSHFARDAGDGAAKLAGIAVLTLAPGRPLFSADELETALTRTKNGRVPGVGAVLVETPVRRLCARAPSYASLAEISGLCRRRGIGLHLDGARLFIAAAAQDVPVRRYAALFDTVYISLYKYLGAQSGAVLAGPKTLLRDIRADRRMFGGSPYGSSYMDAALAERGLKTFEARFARAFRRGGAFFGLLKRRAGARFEIFPDGTNAALLTVRRPETVRASLKRDGVILGRYDRGFRLTINETILSKPLDELDAAFARALRR
jgi:threonine aldolase